MSTPFDPSGNVGVGELDELLNRRLGPLWSNVFVYFVVGLAVLAGLKYLWTDFVRPVASVFRAGSDVIAPTVGSVGSYVLTIVMWLCVVFVMSEWLRARQRRHDAQINSHVLEIVKALHERIASLERGAVSEGQKHA